MKQIAVIGCGFGDEGKGRVVSQLCSLSRHPLVIRFSGGHQAGHHVLTNKFDHVFSNFGSGTFSNAPTYWSQYCTVDPVGIFNEMELLKKINVQPVLYVNENCPVTTTHDKDQNIKREATNGHGTCGVGVGATWGREEQGFQLHFRDLYYPNILNIKLELLKDFYAPNKDRSMTNFIEACKYVQASGTIHQVTGVPRLDYDTYIFEGSQGLLLDQRFGFFPHVARTNTGTKNILDMGFKPEIFLVTRAYQTRHGNGPMTNQQNINIRDNYNERNHDDGFQGSFRRGLLDLNLLKYAIESDSYIRHYNNKVLVITCFDLLRQYKYTLGSAIITCPTEKKFINDIKDYLNIKKVAVSRSPITRI